MNWKMFEPVVTEVERTDEQESIEIKDDEINAYADSRIVASTLKEKLESFIKKIDESLKEKITENHRTWKNDDCSKILEFSYKKTSSINPDIVNELSDSECRKGFIITEKAIKQCGRSDLLDKYKSITESKSLTLKSIKK